MNPVVPFILAAAAYFFPLLVAMVRREAGRTQIFLVNFFFGWSLIGWAIALAMAAGYRLRFPIAAALPNALQKLPSWLLAASLLLASLWLLHTPAGAQQSNLPGEPTEFSASRGTTHRQVLLSWQRPESDGGSPITSFVIHYAKNTRFTRSLETVQVTDVDSASSRFAKKIPGLDQGTRYYFRVAAVNANGQGAWSATEDATPRSVITVAAVNKTITEGDDAEFRVRLWPAPRSNTRVEVEITVEGRFGLNSRSRNVTVRRNENSATLTIRTNNDTSDEPNGSITARVRGQRGYAVGNPRTAKIRINDDDNGPPAFAADTDTRSIPENTAAATNIGDPIMATDPDAGDTLTYSLSGADAASFTIVSSSGQLQTKAALDYETKDSYAVTVTASDGTLSDTIDVTINVTNVNEAPAFAADTDTRSIAENTAATTNIGDPITATDPDVGDILTYSLSGADAASFTIVSNSGQLQTKAALDYKTKSSYTVTVTASDGSLSDTIDVTIHVTTVPGTPIDIEAGRGTTHRQVLLAWQRPESDGGTPITHYVINYAENARFTQNAATVQTAAVAGNPSRLTHKITGLDQGTRYYFRVAAVNANGQGPWSTTEDATPRSVITVAAVNKTITEGDDAEFRVRLWPAPRSNTRVEVEITTEGSYGVNARTRNVTVRRNENSATLTIGTTDDTSQEPDGSITARVRGQSGYAVGSPRTAQITIADNDRPVVTVAAVNATITEGDDAQFQITLSPAPQADTAVAVEISVKGDYGVSESERTVAVTAGQTNATLSLSTDDDAADEPDGSIAVRLTQGQSGYNTGDPRSAEILIKDNDEPAPQVNTAPTVSGDGDIAYAENGTAAVATYSVADPDAGSTHTWSLEGTDAASFSISATGVLTFNTPPDYETKSSYEVTVKATDNGSPALSDSIPVTVSITDVNEAPTVSGDGDIAYAENDTANVATYTVADPDAGSTHTWSVSGDDASSFDIDGSGVLTFKTAPDYESQASYAVTVKATDNGSPALSDSIPVTVSITDVNEAPTVSGDGDIAYAENDTAAVATYSVADPDAGSTHTWSVSGDDASSFDIDGSGVLTFKTAPDYENPADADTNNAYQITVTASDGTLSGSIPVTITVTNENEAPTVSGDGDIAYAENDTAVVATYSVADPDAGSTHTWSLEGTDAASFSISATGVLTFNTPPDYDSQASYAVTVKATDNGSPALSGSLSVTVSITDVNEAPTVSGDGDIAYAENGTAAVATYSVADPDAGSTHTWSLEGTDAASFSISATGVLTFNTPPDYETKSSYEVTVKATDNGSPALSDSIPVTVSITDVNEAPEFTAGDTADYSIAENSAPGTVVGTLTVTDPDAGDSLSYTFAGSDAFTVDSAGQITVATGATLDYETTPAHTLAVTVLDSDGLSDTITVNISVTDVDENEPPTVNGSAAVDYAENGTGDVATYTASDPNAGDTLSWSVEGTDAASFSISATGVLTFKTAPDYENPTDADTNNAYQVTVTVSDGTLSDNIAITISVTNVNEAPAFSSDTLSLTVSENAAAGTVVGTLTVTDPDAGDSLSYTFTSSDTFTVDGSGQIKVADGASLDYETKSAYAVTVTASDLGGLTDTVTVNITVTDVAELPLAPTNLAVAAQGAAILRATWDAPDNTGRPAITGYDVQYRPGTSGEWSDGPQDATALTADVGSLTPNTAYQVRVRAGNADGDGAWTLPVAQTTAALTAPAAPTSLSAAAAGWSQIDLSWTAPAADPNRAAATGYAIEWSADGNDPWTALAAITDAATTTYADTGLASETTRHYRVRATSSVGDGAWSTTASAVTAANRAPSFSYGHLRLNVKENTAPGTVVSDAPIPAASDPDNDTLTYTLDDGNYPEPSFTIDANRQLLVKAGASFDYEEGRPFYVLTLTATDPGGLSASARVFFYIVDVSEPPPAPTNLSATASSGSQIDLSWTAPASVQEQVAATGYAIEWSADGNDPWTALAAITDAATTTYAHTGLASETTRHYRVRATSDAGNGAWSATASATTTANSAPSFPSDTRSLSVSENAAAGTVVGTVTATDPDTGDTLSYTLTGSDAFTIDNAGQITVATGATLDYETTPAYTVTVTAKDSGGLTDTITVNIDLTDVALSYRQVRTWTGRNSDNDADVTLTTYGTWGTSSTPQKAPGITSKTTTETLDDGRVRKTITWTDGNGNNAYQRTAWYNPQTEVTEYRQIRTWSNGLGQTTGEWGRDSAPAAPNLDQVTTKTDEKYHGNGTLNLLIYQYDYTNPQDPNKRYRTFLIWLDPDPGPGPVQVTEAEHPTYTSRIEERTVTVDTDPVYVPAAGPTEEKPPEIENKERP